MSEDIMKLVFSAAVLIATAVLTYVANKHLNMNQREILQKIIETAVAAAEQLYKGQEKSGSLKKAHVITSLYEKGLLKGSSIENITHEIDDMIEAAVYKLSHK